MWINVLRILFTAVMSPIMFAMIAYGEQFGSRSKEVPVQAGQFLDREQIIRVDVNLVLVPVTVTDPIGRVVSGLERENFKLYDDKAPQQIVSFSTEDVSYSVGLLFDASSSMHDKISEARLATQAFLDSANPDDEVFLMTFADRPTMRMDFTSDFSAVTNSLLSANAKGSTALIDAVYIALERMRSAHNPRKALLVVSDGGDNHSRYTRRDLERVAREADVQIHAIGIHDNPRFREEMYGTDLLEGLTKMSGGLHFIIRDVNELSLRCTTNTSSVITCRPKQ